MNYGHTVGHALEAWGHYKKWIHGEAVGLGMVLEGSLAHYLGMCSKDVVERQDDLIKSVGLPSSMPKMKFLDLWQAMQHDKKVIKGNIHCVLPQANWRCSCCTNSSRIYTEMVFGSAIIFCQINQCRSKFCISFTTGKEEITWRVPNN